MIESKNISLLIPRLPDMVQKCLCTPDGAMDTTFQIKYIPSKSVFNLMEIMIIKQIPFFCETPCMIEPRLCIALTRFEHNQIYTVDYLQ